VEYSQLTLSLISTRLAICRESLSLKTHIQQTIF